MALMALVDLVALMALVVDGYTLDMARYGPLLASQKN